MKTKSKIGGVIVAVLLFCMCSCNGELEEVVSKYEVDPYRVIDIDTIVRVERIFMHTTQQYSLLARNNNNDTLNLNTFGSVTPVFITNVPDSLPMWAIFQKTANGGNQILTIHMHSFADIGGAGWNNGKFGSGRTVVIQ